MNKSEIKSQNKIKHLKQILAKFFFNEILNERFLGKVYLYIYNSTQYFLLCIMLHLFINAFLMYFSYIY